MGDVLPSTFSGARVSRMPVEALKDVCNDDVYGGETEEAKASQTFFSSRDSGILSLQSLEEGDSAAPA